MLSTVKSVVTTGLNSITALLERAVTKATSALTLNVKELSAVDASSAFMYAAAMSEKVAGE
jgi:hypothetical protein